VQSRIVRGRDLTVPAFDGHRPPEQSIIDDCVHCGFCLDTCPTYVLWGAEADSPRGRIVLISEGLKADERLSDQMVTHFDRCLGCMACVTACPSGVRYDRLIERVRPQVERHHERTRSERALRMLLFATLPHPKRLRVMLPLLAAARKLGVERLPDRVSALAKVAPRTPVGGARRTALPERTPAVGQRRGRVGVLLGCVQRVFYPQVNRATIHALAAEGFEVIAAKAPDCCGALELHGGAEPAALTRARATIAAFATAGGAEGLDHVVVNAAGCGSAMKAYGELLGTPEAHEFSARVSDVCELLASVEPRAPRNAVPLRVAYHDACHLVHAQGIREQPRALLRTIPELELVVVRTEPDICCGSAGIYTLVQHEAAAELGARKARHVLETGAEAIAAGNPGCAAQLDLHLRAFGRELPIYHPVELLSRSISASPSARFGTVASVR
jgi:glycolate oxidase iron-sulfur subunit